MAWTTPTNVTASSVASSSHMNTEVIANLAHLYAMLGSEAAWTSYTPTNTNVTVGDGTQTAAYFKMGRTVFFRYRLLFGSTTAFTGFVAFGLPVASAGRQVVSAWSFEAGVRGYVGVALCEGSNASPFHTESGSSGGVTSTAPFTWGTADEVLISGVYEAAS